MAVTTFLDIQDRVLDIISKNDATTRARVKNGINMGYSDFVLRELWPFRETVGSLSVTTGTQEYNLSEEFDDIDAQNIVSVAIQGANHRKLPYWPYSQLRANQPDYDYAATSTPERYYLNAGKIGLWPSPNAAMTILLDYFNVPVELEDDDDEPTIPVSYREALVHYALSQEHDFNTDPDLALKSMNRYEQIVTLARNNLLAQPTDTEAFRILGPADFRGHTGLSNERV